MVGVLSPEAPPHLDLLLEQIGVRPLPKDDKPRSEAIPAAGWKPSYLGEEPPF